MPFRSRKGASSLYTMCDWYFTYENGVGDLMGMLEGGASDTQLVFALCIVHCALCFKEFGMV